MRASWWAHSRAGCGRTVIASDIASDIANDKRRDQPTQLLTTALSYPQPDVAVCSAAGEVDTLTAQRLREQLHTANRDKPRCLIVDLSAVTMFSAAGVHALHAARDAQHKKHQLLLVAKTRPVVCVLDICEVRYSRYCNLDHAIAACGSS